MKLGVWFPLRAWRTCAGTWWMIYNRNPDKQVWKLHDGENGSMGPTSWWNKKIWQGQQHPDQQSTMHWYCMWHGNLRVGCEDNVLFSGGISLNKHNLIKKKKDPVLKRNLQASYLPRLCLLNLVHASFWCLYQSAIQVKNKCLPRGIPAILWKCPIFLPANVIGGKQSELPNATAAW